MKHEKSLLYSWKIRSAHFQMKLIWFARITIFCRESIFFSNSRAIFIFSQQKKQLHVNVDLCRKRRMRKKQFNDCCSWIPLITNVICILLSSTVWSSVKMHRFGFMWFFCDVVNSKSSFILVHELNEYFFRQMRYLLFKNESNSHTKINPTNKWLFWTFCCVQDRQLI